MEGAGYLVYEPLWFNGMLNVGLAAGVKDRNPKSVYMVKE